LSFWYQPEANPEFKQWVNFAANSDKKNFILYTETLQLYVHKENLVFTSTLWSAKITKPWNQFVEWNWYNFIIACDNWTCELWNDFIKVGSSITINENNNQLNCWKHCELSDICFTMKACNFPQGMNSHWYPGYYKFIEVHDSTHFEMYNQDIFRTYFSVDERLRYKMRDHYPRLHSLVHQYNMSSWFVDDSVEWLNWFNVF